jgi:hypothetical protein
MMSAFGPRNCGDVVTATLWMNGAFLVREDTHQLFTERDLARAWHPKTFFVWEGSGGSAVYARRKGYRL